MLVYRVEHVKTGTGPYVSCMLPRKAKLLARKLNDAHGMCDDHPSIRIDIHNGDFWGKFSRKQYCGFTCIENLLQWFAGYTHLMGEYGFVIRVYEAKNINFTSSGKQIAFAKSRAKKLREIPL